MTIPELGIIEGYFGRSWSWVERADVVSRLAPAGYRFFHYAPKIESKLRRAWQELHSTQEAEAISSFAAHCRAHGVRFGVGLTPYGAHLDFSDEVRSALVAKLAQLDAMGIEDLAILFDDMRGDVPDLADRQADIVAFILDNSRATRFFMCPSYYSHDPVLDRVFGARPADYLETLGRRIDPAVPVYWTGEEVCSAEYSYGHLREISAQLGRRLALWDNYPVNDGPRMSQYLHLRAFTGRPAHLGTYVSHHAINPASQPILGCIPTLTLPQSYRLGDDYRYGAAFLEAAIAVAGADLAAMLQADILTLQDSGLDRLGDRLPKLRAKYATVDHPAAREVVDWLDGGYEITGEMLQTQ
ncbi:MAG: beta-N-acetylglucosaminidase domain-containing protein [Sphingomonadaceae bacterium]